jgi:hypothetical protein
MWIEGAKHYLTPGWIADAFAEKIAGWIGENMPAKKTFERPLSSAQ